MDKRADTRFPVADLIGARWSPRAFAKRSLDTASLGSLMEAARWAASCFNEQPWRFIVARSEQAEEHARLAACLVDANRAWAEKAPLLILSVAAKGFARNGKDNHWARHDVGLAVGGLSAQATQMGLVLHQMAGFDGEKARETYAIPENYEPVAVIAVGYPAEPADLDEDLAAREAHVRVRKPLEELVFSGTWARPLAWD